MIQIEAAPEEIYDIELEHSLLEANAKLAKANRALLDRHGVTAIDFMGAIGSGKTTLITRLVEKLKDRFGIAVFNGDGRRAAMLTRLKAWNSCRRSPRSMDATSMQISSEGLPKIDLSKLNLIFVENIGNLICPAEFPLGSKARVVVVSVTEGPYMVRKHPHMFLGAEVVVINKIDLAAAMEVSVEDLARDVHTLKPDIKVIATSCKTGVGLKEVAAALVAV
jgi:hydrogenase nickel incorporation protein HypB